MCHILYHASPITLPVPMYKHLPNFDFARASSRTGIASTFVDCISSITAKSTGIDLAASKSGLAEYMYSIEPFLKRSKETLPFLYVSTWSIGDSPIARFRILNLEKTETWLLRSVK